MYTKNFSLYSKVLNYLEAMRFHYGDDAVFICGHEAGCLGFTLYHRLAGHHVKCVIPVPTCGMTISLCSRKSNCRSVLFVRGTITVIVKTGDFKCFASAARYASYLGLVPGGDSSGDCQRISLFYMENVSIHKQKICSDF